jgi:hypothetical protein
LRERTVTVRPQTKVTTKVTMFPISAAELTIVLQAMDALAEAVMARGEDAPAGYERLDRKLLRARDRLQA